ncbi:MAG: nucleotidyltransferase family protein [Pirellulales bacterium]
MIDAIVLAAGRSRRMQTQKLLLPFAGQTVIGHIVDQVLAGHIRQVFVVVSNEDDPVAVALSAKPVILAVNRDPDAEMLSSVRVGLRALSTDAAAAMIVLGDQPALQREVIHRLVTSFQASGKGVLAPAYDGKRGHPLLIAARYFDELQQHYDDVGLRGLLMAHADDIEDIPIADAGVLADMDHPEDYERELARYRTAGYRPER